LSRHTIADLASKKRSIRERLGLTTAEAVSEDVLAQISAA
jgi:Rrf2 family iron-responsive transcriptional regulator